MATRSFQDLDRLILRYLHGEATLQDIMTYWRCKDKRAYQLVNQLAQELTGNYRCRDAALLTRLYAKKEMDRRVGTYAFEIYVDTPRGFYEYEINKRACVV